MAQANSEQESVIPWDPTRVLRRIDAGEVRLSRGFLRSRPERWFPAFPTHWLPLAHSLGVEFKVTEVRPMMTVPRGLQSGFACSVDGEPFAILLDETSTSVFLDTVAPGASGAGQEIVGEYLARRLLVSLEASWSGPESAVVRFESEKDPFAVPVQGAVKVSVEVHGSSGTVWIALGRMLVDRLDGLWRRQLRSTRAADETAELQIEVAQLAVPPAALVEYVRSGTVIDLDTPAGDQVLVRVEGKPWLPARLSEVEGRFALEMLAGPTQAPVMPDGTTRMSICLLTRTVDSQVLGELSQTGALWDTGLPLGDTVEMVINGEKVAEATLGTFEGRFAITVI